MNLKKLFTAATLLVSTFLCTSIANATTWRDLPVKNSMLLELPTGKVVIELNDTFAPKHVAQISRLTKQGFYKDSSFYRVIDGFVAQGGVGDNSDEPALPLEARLPLKTAGSFIAMQQGDLFAEHTGFINDFAAAVNKRTQQAWLLHCPGSVGMSRDNNPDTATTDFYITIGQAPRYLDQIMTVWGRVVYGMDHVQKLNRTQVIEGEAAVKSENYSPILNMRLMSDVPKDEQIRLQVEDTTSAEFALKMIERRDRDHPFFFEKPPLVLDVCQIPLQVRLKPETK